MPSDKVKAPRRRSGVAIAAMMRTAAKFKHRAQPRGGQSNKQRDLLDEYEEQGGADTIDAEADDVIEENAMSEKKPHYQALEDANQRAAALVQSAVVAIAGRSPRPVSKQDAMLFAKHALAALREHYPRASCDDLSVMEEAAHAIEMLLKVL